METRRASLLIAGKVQGVFFRESARREALGLGIKGWVRNLSSGEVEAMVEGEPQAVEDFVVWCRQGPPSARVEAVKVQESRPTGEFTTFSVERSR